MSQFAEPVASDPGSGGDRLATLYACLHQTEIRSLNGLRTIAVAAVVADHSGLDVRVFSGGEGVMLFFVLSGFLITWLLLKEQARYGSISVRNFYVRRSLRIFPAFYLYWLVVIAALLAHHTRVQWGHALSCALYFNNYYYAFSTSVIGWFQHAWSLAVEEQFYLLWPIAFVLLSRRPERLVKRLVWVILAVWVYRAVLCYAGGSERYMYRAFDTRADHLLVGCVLAVVLQRRSLPRLWKGLCTWPAFVACVLIYELSLYLDKSHDFRFSVGAAVEGPVLAALLLQSIVLAPRVLDVGPMRYLGRISYGLYLYHELGNAIALRLVGGYGVFVIFVGTFAATAGLAAMSYHFFEEPILRRKERWRIRRAPPPALRAATSIA